VQLRIVAGDVARRVHSALAARRILREDIPWRRKVLQFRQAGRLRRRDHMLSLFLVGAVERARRRIILLVADDQVRHSRVLRGLNALWRGQQHRILINELVVSVLVAGEQL